VEVALEHLDDRYAQLRLKRPDQYAAMRRSMERFGQLAPAVATPRETRLAVVDGFKRLCAARELGLVHLVVRPLELSEQGAVVALYSLNQVSRSLLDFEEALVVHALVRTHGLSQVEVGELLDHHKSWVSRRLALVERLSDEVQDDLRVGLTSMTVAREVLRLPRGNQGEVTQAIAHHALTSREALQLVSLFEGTSSRSQQRFLLEQPREALAAREAARVQVHDPRLGAQANRLRKLLY
jgi:ParB-like chromosome segregation protein Spo0J